MLIFINRDVSAFILPLLLAILIGVTIALYVGLHFYGRSGAKAQGSGANIPKLFSPAGLRYFLVRGYDVRCMVIAAFSAIEKGVYEVYTSKSGPAYRLKDRRQVKDLTWDEKAAFTRNKKDYHKVFSLKGHTRRSLRMHSRLKIGLKKKYGHLLDDFRWIKGGLVVGAVILLWLVTWLVGDLESSFNILLMIFFCLASTGLSVWLFLYVLRIGNYWLAPGALIGMGLYILGFQGYADKPDLLLIHALLGVFVLLNTLLFDRVSGYSREGRQLLPAALAFQKQVLEAPRADLDSYYLAVGGKSTNVDAIIQEMIQNLGTIAIDDDVDEDAMNYGESF